MTGHLHLLGRVRRGRQAGRRLPRRHLVIFAALVFAVQSVAPAAKTPPRRSGLTDAVSVPNSTVLVLDGYADSDHGYPDPHH